MWPFKRVDTNYRQQMQEIMKTYMLQYIKQFPENSHDAVPIFFFFFLMVRNSSEQEISKTLKKSNLTVESGALNIIQNNALVRIREKSGSDFVLGALSTHKDVAYELYEYINDIKLKKGFISKKQYEENSMVGVKASLKTPF